MLLPGMKSRLKESQPVAEWSGQKSLSGPDATILCQYPLNRRMAAIKQTGDVMH